MLFRSVAPDGYFFSAQNTIKAGTAQYQGEKNYIYAAVMAVNTTTRQITLNQHIPDGAIASKVIPTQATDFAVDTKSGLYSDEVTPTRLASLIRSYQSFAIRYDLVTATFRIIASTDISNSAVFSLENTGDTTGREIGRAHV